MNSPPNTTKDQTRASNQFAVSLVASETVFHPGNSEDLIVSELVLEAEMNRRAAVVTEVLARIIEHPAPPHHWGLNE